MYISMIKKADYSSLIGFLFPFLIIWTDEVRIQQEE